MSESEFPNEIKHDKYSSHEDKVSLNKAINSINNPKANESSLAKSFKIQDKDRAIKNFNFLTGKFSANANLFTQSIKSEFKFDKNNALPPLLRPIVDDFLTLTSFLNESNKESERLKELELARLALANSTTVDEILENVLSLASLYHEYDYLEEAKLATKLSLGLDPNNLTGKQLFQKLEKIPDLGSSVAVDLHHEALNKNDLANIINKFPQGKILVIGDLLIDELWEGKPQRISREAPVMILEHVDTLYILGGAANTANNIACLDGKCHSIGVCGDDIYQPILKNLLDSKLITHNLFIDPTRKTTVKTRILSKSHSQMQQLLRLDKIDYHEISTDMEQKILALIDKIAPNYDAIVLSDYRCGLVSQSIINLAAKIKQTHNKFVIVDAQSNFARFKGVSLITPNQPDTESMLKKKITNNYTIYDAGHDVLKLTQSDCVLITRGEHGMALFEGNNEVFELPAFNRSNVFDVTGAGDTVVATIALALSVGANYKQATALGNLAAGLVVKKPGTATVSRSELLANLDILAL